MEYWTKYYNKNKLGIIRKQTAYNRRIKRDVFEHYGMKCACCFNKIEQFLTIDHIEGRKKWNHNHLMKGASLYAWLKRNNYPEGFQLLCWNCNITKGKYGECPHKAIINGFLHS